MIDIEIRKDGKRIGDIFATKIKWENYDYTEGGRYLIWTTNDELKTFINGIITGIGNKLTLNI